MALSLPQDKLLSLLEILEKFDSNTAATCREIEYIAGILLRKLSEVPDLSLDISLIS